MLIRLKGIYCLNKPNRADRHQIIVIDPRIVKLFGYVHNEAKISLKNANPDLKLYALASSGRRLREVKAAYAGGAYVFTAKIAPGEGADAPTMMYELAK